MLIYAHRGSSATAPENTLAAFRQAIADGADGVELDVRATRDGVLVVLHDRDLGRTTNGAGAVDETTLDELQRLDAGGGERVPTLDQVLALLAGRLRLDLEVKQPGIERALLSTLAGHPAASWAISAFDWAVLTAVRALSDDADLWPLSIVASDDLFAAAATLRTTTVALHGAAVTPAVVRRCDAADVDLMVWTVNDIERARLARLHGVAALCTDDPATIIAGLRRDPA